MSVVAGARNPRRLQTQSQPVDQAAAAAYTDETASTAAAAAHDKSEVSRVVRFDHAYGEGEGEGESRDGSASSSSTPLFTPSSSSSETKGDGRLHSVPSFASAAKSFLLHDIEETIVEQEEEEEDEGEGDEHENDDDDDDEDNGTFPLFVILAPPAVCFEDFVALFLF